MASTTTVAGDRGSRGGCTRRRDVASGGGKQAASCGQAVRYASECAGFLARRPDGELHASAPASFPPEPVAASTFVAISSPPPPLPAPTLIGPAPKNTGVRLLVTSNAATAAVGIFALDGGAISPVGGFPSGGCQAGISFRLTGTEKWAVGWQLRQRVSAVRLDHRPPPLHHRRGHLDRPPGGVG